MCYYVLQYSISEYRERLYMEIVKRKKEIRKQMKEKEALRAGKSSSKSRSRDHAATSAAEYPTGNEVYAK